MRFGINEDFGFKELTVLQRTRLIAAAGFSAVFCRWPQPGSLEATAAACRETGLDFEFVHMGYAGIDLFWHGSREEAESELARQTECLRECAEHGVTLAVQHVFQGFTEPHPTSEGVYWFGRLLDEAQKLGIRIALENTEGEAYLDRLRGALWEHPAAGFCWDSGHESCYNRSRNMLADYGSRLLATHLNDNLGVSGAEIDWHDDLHLIPYDGAIDWTKAAHRLAGTGYDGILTFEMKDRNLPGRHDSDRYAALSPAEYLARVYTAAERFTSELEAARTAR